MVDQHDLPVPPGTPGAKVLVTNLVDDAQPLIRYELSDVVTLRTAPTRPRAPTGGSPRSRAGGWTLPPRRGGGEVALHPTGLSPAFASLPRCASTRCSTTAAAVEAAGAVAPP